MLFRKIRNYFRRKDKEWEALCKRCGLCCYEKVKNSGGGWDIALYLPCEHLDTKTNLCRVYHNRFRRCSQCGKVTIYHALFAGYLPKSCGYVQHFRKWRIFSKYAQIRKK